MAFQEPVKNEVPNRVSEAIYAYAELEAQLKINNPPASQYDPSTIELKLDYYSNLYTALKKTPNPDEKLSLRYLQHEIAKMKARLSPTTLNRILYSGAANLLRNFFNGNNILYNHHNKVIKNITTKLVQEHNLHSLTESMKKAGFRHSIEGPLAKMIAQDLPQFHLRYADVHHKDTDFVLHFKKVPNTDLYYLEKFDAISRPSLDALLKNDHSRFSYTFSQVYQKFSAREAANLVNGRPVCKNEIWQMLTRSEHRLEVFIQQFNFNLEKALKKLPIKGIDNPKQYEAIVDTLKSGQTKDVTLAINGRELKCKLEAAPHNKTIYVLDKNDALLDIDKLLRQQRTTSQQVTEKLNQEINLGEEAAYKIRRR